MSTLTLNKLTNNVGAEVTGLDADRLVNDESLTQEILVALEDNGVLVFPKLDLGPETQVALCERLGDVDYSVGRGVVPGIMLVTLDPAKSLTAEYLRGTFIVAHRRMHVARGAESAGGDRPFGGCAG